MNWKERAKYGKHVLRKLSESLTKEFGRGFSKTNLEYVRKFYLTYADRISQTLFEEFAVKKSQTVFEELDKEQPFIVSWSHYLQLMRIENVDERKFYEIESVKSSWGIRTLQRQYNSSLYERLALSREKDEARQTETAEKKMAEYWDKLDVIEKDIVIIMGSRNCITATELSVMIGKTRRTVNKKINHLLELEIIKMNGNKHNPALTYSLYI